MTDTAAQLAARLEGVSLYLVGMMGAGKSTFGQTLAQAIAYRFVDTDALVEAVAGCSIAEIFAQEGEAAFRELETQVLAQVSTFTNLVVATGGGIVQKPVNWSYLRHGVVVWLDVPPPELFARLQRDTSRPLLQTADPLATLTTLATERQSLYAQADLRLAGSQQSPYQLLGQLANALQAYARPQSGQLRASSSSSS